MSFVFTLLLPIFLLIIPIILQFKIGNKMLSQNNKIKYFMVSTSFIILEILMAILGFILSLKGQQMAGLSGLSPGFIVFGFFGIIILFVVILSQITSNRLK
jgi:hypothetical protein